MRSSVRARVAGLTIAALFLASIFMAAAPRETAGAGTVAVYVKLDEIQKTIQVIPGMGGVVTFTGEIQTEIPVEQNAQVVIVSIVASVPEEPDWHVTDIPTLVVSRSQTTLSFSFSIRVPLSSITSGMEMVRKVIIEGTWVYEPGLIQGDVPRAEGIVYLGQYYQYAVTSREPHIQTSPGGEVKVELEIINEGNGDDIIVVDVQNKDYLASEGWVVEQKERKFELPYQGSIVVPIRVIAPVNWDPWVNEITFIKFRIYSMQAENSQTLIDGEQVLYSIYISQSGASVPGFEPSMVILAVLLTAGLYLHRRRS